jgi:hypothetical protein
VNDSERPNPDALLAGAQKEDEGSGRANKLNRGEGRVRLFDNLAEAAKANQAAALTRLRSNSSGLTWIEARRRLEDFGPNELASQKPPPWPVVLWQALKHPFNGVLTALAE